MSLVVKAYILFPTPIFFLFQGFHIEIENLDRYFQLFDQMLVFSCY
jgi:hypothetical protein